MLKLTRAHWAILTSVWLALVLYGTLRPDDVPTSAGFCILCGDRGLADALLNIAMFVPLGIGARRLGPGPLLVFALGFLLSGSIETTQFFIPGRDASVGDVVMNSLGGLIGGLLSPHIETLLRPDGRVAKRLTIGWGTGLVLYVWAIALLLEPRIPGEAGRLVVTPVATDSGTYRGIVARQRLTGAPLREGDLVSWPSDEPVGRLEVDIASVFFESEFRPLVGLAPTGDSIASLMTFGSADKELILRLARPIDVLRLTPADLLQPNALDGFERGDSLTVSAWRENGTFCLAVAAREWCGFGFTTGSGWAFFLPPSWGNGGLERHRDAAWLALLFFPLGFWRGGRALAVTLGAAVASVVMAPAMTQLLLAPVATLGGSAAGLGLGLVASWLRPRARTED
ncbi:MAG: VanZ family protein [Gemmatimonadetes bacterium]|nr:VanZ family protein [Gemmatimonadota bacterium]